jgi:hypothetical protein
MRRAQHPVFECIGKALNSQYDAIVQEPLPQRWVNLIRYLSERERTPSNVQTEKGASDREPPMQRN